jgi:tRNA nucleotidyltransferase (CCA-adding enzyme)
MFWKYSFYRLFTKMSSPVAASFRSGPIQRTIKTTIYPTENEAEIFRLLRDCVSKQNLPVTLRVAGGWVRDKLLGIECHDLDIAIDNMMGESFAKAFLSHLHAVGVPASSCGVIASNPERSKHLETATMVLHGLELDFVNLRAESYAIDSRIPHKIVLLSLFIYHHFLGIWNTFGGCS